MVASGAKTGAGFDVLDLENKVRRYSRRKKYSFNPVTRAADMSTMMISIIKWLKVRYADRRMAEKFTINAAIAQSTSALV